MTGLLVLKKPSFRVVCSFAWIPSMKPANRTFNVVSELAQIARARQSRRPATSARSRQSERAIDSSGTVEWAATTNARLGGLLDFTLVVNLTGRPRLLLAHGHLVKTAPEDDADGESGVVSSQLEARLRGATFSPSMPLTATTLVSSTFDLAPLVHGALWREEAAPDDIEHLPIQEDVLLPSRHDLDDRGTRPGASLIADLYGLDDDIGTRAVASWISNLDGVDDGHLPNLAAVQARVRATAPIPTDFDVSVLPSACGASSAKVESPAEKKFGRQQGRTLVDFLAMRFTIAREKRASFTQYTPGAILCVIDNSFRTEGNFAREDPVGYAWMCQSK
ncbi:hypothetical protein B0H15DRAFT_1022114 [Mycena belliarum]|uniref:Uncharacterized protein n=1 Tax=Mycena belliarum TaxID=1033014 RepID=A0AAD6XSK8_9AGAR|nr:hypothetical protein B0H15DRAFT_1022114 [Mycena belliae]